MLFSIMQAVEQRVRVLMRWGWAYTWWWLGGAWCGIRGEGDGGTEGGRDGGHLTSCG